MPARLAHYAHLCCLLLSVVRHRAQHAHTRSHKRCAGDRHSLCKQHDKCVLCVCVLRREQQLWDRQQAMMDRMQQQWDAERQVGAAAVSVPTGCFLACANRLNVCSATPTHQAFKGRAPAHDQQLVQELWCNYTLPNPSLHAPPPNLATHHHVHTMCSTCCTCCLYVLSAIDTCCVFAWLQAFLAREQQLVSELSQLRQELSQLLLRQASTTAAAQSITAGQVAMASSQSLTETLEVSSASASTTASVAAAASSAASRPGMSMQPGQGELWS